MQQQTTFDRYKRALKKHPITISILTINTIFMIVSYILNYYLFRSFTLQTNTLVLLGGLVPSYISNFHQYYRLITPMFLHGGLIHFLLNSYFLYVIGRFVEDLLGRKNFLLIYVLSGLGSSLLIWGMYELNIGDNVVTIGASGALYGLMGALLILTYKRPTLFNPYGIRSIRQLVIINVVITLISASSGGNISLFGHAGGLIAGIMIIYIILNFQTPTKDTYKNDQTKTRHGRYVIDADDVSDDDIYYTN